MATNEGTTSNGVVTAEDTAAAAAKAQLVTNQKDAIALDKAIDRDLKKISDTIKGVAQKLAQAKRGDTWRLVMNPSTDKPFTSFAKYLESKAELLPGGGKGGNGLAIKVRKDLVQEMVAYGMTLAEMAAVTGASRATLSGDRKESGNAAEGGSEGGPGTRTETPETRTKRALKALELALVKVADATEDMTEEQLDAVIIATTEALRQAKASKASQYPSKGKVTADAKAPSKATSKATPATVTAARQPVAASA